MFKSETDSTYQNQHSRHNDHLRFRAWTFAEQEEIKDIIGIVSHETDPWDEFGEESTHRGAPAMQYITFGKNSMVCVYVIDESSGQVSLAGMVATRLTSAVSSAMASLSKSFWGAATSTISTEPSRSPSPSLQTSTLQPLLTVTDSSRSIVSVVPAPRAGTASSSRPTLAAGVDSLGRVLILDLEQNEVIRMLKGARHAQVGWIWVDRPMSDGQSGFTGKLLCLCVYSGRGILEVFSMKYGDRLAVSNVGRGCKLIDMTDNLLAGSLKAKVSEKEAPGYCLLINPSGAIVKVELTYGEIPTQEHCRPRDFLVQIRKMCDEIKGVEQDALMGGPLERIREFLLAVKDQKLQAAALAVLPDHLPFVSSLTSSLAEKCEGASLRTNLPDFSRHKMGLIYNPKQTAISDILLRNHLLSIVKKLDTLKSKQVGSGASEWDDKLLTVVNEDFTFTSVSSPSHLQFGEEPEMETFRHSTFLSSFCVDMKRNDGGISFAGLRRGISSEELLMVSTVLVGSASSGLIVLKIWRREVFEEVSLGITDWLRLLFHSVLIISDLECDMSTDVALRLARVSSIIFETIGKSKCVDVLETLFQFFESTSKITQAYFLASVAKVTLANLNASTRARFDDILLRLKDCVFLYRRFSPMMRERITLTASTIGASEKTSVPKLIATYHLDRALSGQPFDTQSNDEFMQFFGRGLSTEMTIYLANELLHAWHYAPMRMDLLKSGVEMIEQFGHPTLRNAIICFIFEKYLGPKLHSVVDVIDKGRKAPKDQTSLRMYGMDVAVTKEFIVCCLAVLGENVLILEPGYMSSVDMRTDVVEALRLPPLQRFESYADDIFGQMIKMLVGLSSGQDMAIN
ncbi:Rab3 GTPase-activating protein non-catalytic subunit, partial [Blyttiomyces sp. JEL0837]